AQARLFSKSFGRNFIGRSYIKAFPIRGDYQIKKELPIECVSNRVGNCLELGEKKRHRQFFENRSVPRIRILRESKLDGRYRTNRSFRSAAISLKITWSCACTSPLRSTVYTFPACCPGLKAAGVPAGVDIFKSS